MSREARPHVFHKPELHEIVKDTSGNVGEFMGEVFGTYQLRPMGGGKEWDVAPADIRECSAEEKMRAKLAVANARSTGAL